MSSSPSLAMNGAPTSPPTGVSSGMLRLSAAADGNSGASFTLLTRIVTAMVSSVVSDGVAVGIHAVADGHGVRDGCSLVS